MKQELTLNLEIANEISKKTPNLCHLAPAGDTFMEDLNEAGGIYAVMNEINKLGLLSTDLLTVTGKTVAENIEGCVNLDPEIIRPVENPYITIWWYCCFKRKYLHQMGLLLNNQQLLKK